MRRRGTVRAALAATAGWTCLTQGAWAQTRPEPGAQTSPPQVPSARPHDFSILALPIPISDPAVGSGLALGVGVLYRAGGSERPWITGGATFYTDNGTKGAAAFQKAYLDGDRFRVVGAGGAASVNIDFYGIGPDAGARGVSIPINQEAAFAGAQVLMRVAPDLYAGIQYRLLDMKTTIQTDILPMPDLEIPPLELDSTTSALGLSAEYDTRDNEYQPSRGLYVTGVWLAADQAWGSDRDYSRAEVRANGYRRAGEKAIWAWRTSTCWAADSAPFYDICNYGSQGDLRGYASGQYRDRAMVAVQAEYRRKLFGRLGFVAFAGIGGVGAEFDDIIDEPLPSAGVGIRYEASRKYGVNVGIDYAVGEESSAFYFRIGEAF